ncbi:hypothetical protein QFZ43_006502 [Streptomyces afghaniensis]|nr:hypothetical protein [Streptomyces afghaniensis]
MQEPVQYVITDGGNHQSDDVQAYTLRTAVVPTGACECRHSSDPIGKALPKRREAAPGVTHVVLPSFREHAPDHERWPTWARLNCPRDEGSPISVVSIRSDTRAPWGRNRQSRQLVRLPMNGAASPGEASDPRRSAHREELLQHGQVHARRRRGPYRVTLAPANGPADTAGPVGTSSAFGRCPPRVVGPGRWAAHRGGVARLAGRSGSPADVSARTSKPLQSRHLAARPSRPHPRRRLAATTGFSRPLLRPGDGRYPPD